MILARLCRGFHRLYLTVKLLAERVREREKVGASPKKLPPPLFQGGKYKQAELLFEQTRLDFLLLSLFFLFPRPRAFSCAAETVTICAAAIGSHKASEGIRDRSRIVALANGVRGNNDRCSVVQRARACV